MIPVTIITIPHRDQRYDTVGDWLHAGEEGNPDRLGDVIRVSVLGNRRHELLVAVHELTEMFLCREDGVRGEDVTRFDVQFEKENGHSTTGSAGQAEAVGAAEPGESPLAPYFKQHRIATQVEKYLAELLGVDWDAYERDLESVGK